MKRCPHCAEEIQDEAKKCKHCGERVDGPAPAAAAVAAAPALAPAGGAQSPHPDEPRTVLYEGSPSWRAFFWTYVLVCAATPAVVVAAYFAVDRWSSGFTSKAIAIAAPLLLGVIAFFVVDFVRKRVRVRVTNRGIENEKGILSKRIDVLELWRVKDLRYRQSVTDRILGIAHIDIFTKDVTTPHMEIVGMPASRPLFEKIRDSIEIQRQSRRVLGLME